MLDKLCDHVAQNRPHGVKSLVSSTNICKAYIVEQDFLYNEDSHRLAQFRSGFHDTEAKGNDLRGKKEVDDIRGVVFHQGTDHAQGSKTEIFKWARLGSGIEERIEEKRNMGYSKQRISHGIQIKKEKDTGTYHSKTMCGSRYETQHTGAEPVHCRHDLMQLQSAGKDSRAGKRR